MKALEYWMCFLLAAVALLRFHFEDNKKAGSVSGMPPQSESSTTTATSVEPWARGYRLLAHARPRHYDLTLQPNLKQGTFSGVVAITVEVNESCKFLAVHIKDLQVTKARVTLPDSITVFPLQENPFLYEPHEFFVMKAEFPVGLYILHFEFNGHLTDKIIGFYRTEYKEHKDPCNCTKRYFAASKFLPTYARQAFPCFDEPEFKSKFTIRLVRPTDGYSALSNMDVEKEIPDSPELGLTTVVFKESAPMATYLVCIVVSQFTSLDPIMVDKVPLRVYAKPSQTCKTKYALEIGANITEYYIDYFKIQYPLPKLDMIAIPDYVVGAMEHWGLITYREVNILYDSQTSSSANKQRVGTVIGHELAHMWFGNLMTLKWWDDIWLIEGFATYMQYKGTHHANPDWAMMDQFLIDDLHPVLILDASYNSHPIVQQAGHPEEIIELFDTISYNKGAAVLRMLEDFIGQGNFQKGISAFLNAYKFDNAVTQDMWDVLQKFEDKNSEHPTNFTQVMNTWTHQMGFPVITVVVGENGDRVLSQSRFLANPNASKTHDVSSPYEYKWEVPITYITSDSKTVTHTWLYSNTSNVTVPVKEKPAWIKFNCHQVGYYKVNYSAEEWTVFSKLLVDDIKALDPSDRANLLDDAFSIADAGLCSYDVALEMTKYLTKEDQYVPWSVASAMFTKLRDLLTGTSAYTGLRRYIRSLVDSIYNSVTWDVHENDSHLKRRLRGVVLNLACSIGHDKCLDEVKKEFEKWLSSCDDRPDPDVRDLVYFYGMKVRGNEETWDTVWSHYLKEEDVQEKAKLLSCLAAVQESWLLERFIQYSKNETSVRSQDFFTVLQYISNNPVGTTVVWDFVRSEWESLVKRFTLKNHYLGRLIPTITKSFATELKLTEMESFFNKYPNASGILSRDRSLEAVVSNINWRKQHEASMAAWFSAHTNSTVL